MIESVIKSHLAVPFIRPPYYQSLQGYIGAAQSFPCTLFPPHLPCSSGVLLCCQITKWLFACYKQRKQILYRYYIYIYIDMFFHWEMRIGIFTYTSDTHSQRQYTHLSIQTQTYSKYRHGSSNLWKNLKETHFLIMLKINLIFQIYIMLLCYAMKCLFFFLFLPI